MTTTKQNAAKIISLMQRIIPKLSNNKIYMLWAFFADNTEHFKRKWKSGYHMRSPKKKKITIIQKDYFLMSFFYWLGTRDWSEKNLPRSVESTLVTCWKKQGCEMSHFLGGGAAVFLTLLLLLFLLPVIQKRNKLDVLDALLGVDNRILAGSDVSVSMCRKSCWAASAESKLSPAIWRWSVDVLIVWNVGPAAS